MVDPPQLGSTQFEADIWIVMLYNFICFLLVTQHNLLVLPISLFHVPSSLLIHQQNTTKWRPSQLDERNEPHLSIPRVWCWLGSNCLETLLVRSIFSSFTTSSFINTFDLLIESIYLYFFLEWQIELSTFKCLNGHISQLVELCSNWWRKTLQHEKTVNLHKIA